MPGSSRVVAVESSFGRSITGARRTNPEELSRSYLTISGELTRVMTRLKAVYRSWAIPCAVSKSMRALSCPVARKISEAGVAPGEFYYQQLDALRSCASMRRELLVRARNTRASKLLASPLDGPIRAAQLIAILQTPHRFRTKRQLWLTAVLASRTPASVIVMWKGNCDHRRGPCRCAGSTAITITNSKTFSRVQPLSRHQGWAFSGVLRGSSGQGIRPEMARLTVAPQNCSDHVVGLEERSPASTPNI